MNAHESAAPLLQSRYPRLQSPNLGEKTCAVTRIQNTWATAPSSQIVLDLTGVGAAQSPSPAEIAWLEPCVALGVYPRALSWMFFFPCLHEHSGVCRRF